jgi:hypothetical protein
MDGFTSIPIQNGSVNSGTIGNTTSSPLNQGSPLYNSSHPYKDNAVTQDDGIEINDPNEIKKVKSSFGFLLPLSVLSLLLVIAYFGYLVFVRFMTLEKISILSADFNHQKSR